MNGHDLTNASTPSPTTLILQRPNLPSELLSQLNEFRLHDQFTDAILSVHQEELPCHRCVLASSSPYFHATFSNEFQEAIDAKVILHDISPWIMKRILDYIYTGSLEISVEHAQDYLRTGHMLHYPPIVEASCDLLSQHLHPDNCLGMKEFATMFHCEGLETSAYEFALENFTQVIEKSDELMDLPVDSLVKYLSADNVNISNEGIIWKAISRWINFDSEERRKHLFDLLSCIRIPVLSVEDLSAIRNNPLVRSQPRCVQLLERVASMKSTKPELMQPPSPTVKDQSASLLNDKKNLLGYQQGARPSTLPRDVVVLFGGISDYEMSQMIAYDPLKERWIKLPTPPEIIIKASITCFNNTVYITGGIINNTLSNVMWKFCCKEKKWTQGTPLREARARHSSVVMNGVLYLSGGVRLNAAQTVEPMTEIHAYDIPSDKWAQVGFNNTHKLSSTLLGFNDTLYELGGQTDGSFANTMEMYKVMSNGKVTCTGEHYVLPCNGEPGPLEAVLDERDMIILLWTTTGQLFSLNTDGRRFYRIEHSFTGLSGCLAAFNHKVYILGGNEDNKPSTEGRILALSTTEDIVPAYTWSAINIPPDLIIHKCVHVQM